MTDEINRRPATLSVILAVLAAMAMALVGALFSWIGFVFGALGGALLAIALANGSRGVVDLAGFLLLLGVVGTGLGDAPEVATLACAVLAVVAWDLANNAVEIGQQLGREAATARTELVHAGATLAVGTVGAAVAYAGFQVAGGGQPEPVVVFLVLAAVVIVSAMRL